jgi:hypothetical protein
MMSGPHIFGDPPLHPLRFTSNPLSVDDGQELPRRRVRVITRPAPAVRFGELSRVAFLITVGDDVVPQRIEVDTRIVRHSALSVEKQAIPQPRTVSED